MVGSQQRLESALFQWSGHPSSPANFSPYKHSGFWTGQGETIRAGASASCCQILALAKGPIYKRSLKMPQLEGTLFNWTTFLHITARPNWWGWPCVPKWFRVKRKVTSFRGKLKESGTFCSRKLIFDISSTDTEPDEKPKEVIDNSLMLNQFSPRTLVS